MSCTAITIFIGLATCLLLNESSKEHIPHAHIAKSIDLLLCVMRMSRKHKAYMHNALMGTVDRRGYEG